jgi:hypothetical protein
MAKPTSLDRARDEIKLMNEIYLIAGIDAYRRHLMHIVAGLSNEDVVEWYFKEHPHMRRYVDRHIEAGTCAAAVVELQKEREQERRPEPAAPSATTIAPTSENLENWFRDRVETWPDDKPAPTQDDDFIAAKAYFSPNPTRQAVRDARTKIAPAQWQKQGPRKPGIQTK